MLDRPEQPQTLHPGPTPALRPQVKVIRNGQQQTVPNYEVVVGDLMLLDTGDKIIADGYITEVRALPSWAGSGFEDGRLRRLAKARCGAPAPWWCLDAAEHCRARGAVQAH